MRVLKNYCLLAVVSLILYVQPVFAETWDGIWYDADRMAVAINLGHSTWNEYSMMGIDFNADRNWGQIVDGGLYVNIKGEMVRRFNFGVFKFEETSYGSMTSYGWSPSGLFENETIENWAAFSSTLYDGVPTPEGLHCFSEIWQPAPGSQIVYCRPLDVDGNSVSVLPEDLDHVYVRFAGRDWTPLPLYKAPLVPVRVTMDVTPNELSADSMGNYVTVKIDLPYDFHPSSASIDMNILYKTVGLDNQPLQAFTKPVKWTSYESGWKNGLRQLSFKLPRNEFVNIPAGRYQLVAIADINNGAKLIASGEITIR